MIMKRLFFAGLSITLLLSGCSTPLLPPALAPTMTAPPPPTPTTGPEGAFTPELVLDITNESDPLKTPYGIALDSTGKIYVNDAGNSRVLVFDNNGTQLAKWDQKGNAKGEFNSLGFGGVAIDANDNVFVVDNGNHRIQKFDAAGKFLTQWGNEGTGDG